MATKVGKSSLIQQNKAPATAKAKKNAPPVPSKTALKALPSIAKKKRIQASILVEEAINVPTAGRLAERAGIHSKGALTQQVRGLFGEALAAIVKPLAIMVVQYPRRRTVSADTISAIMPHTGLDSRSIWTAPTTRRKHGTVIAQIQPADDDENKTASATKQKKTAKK